MICNRSISLQDLSSAERARKAVEAERDELLEEINNSTASKYVACFNSL